MKLPFDQIYWFNKPRTEFIHLIGTKINAKIIFSDKNKRLINASVKLLEDDPWESIHKALPKGTDLNGKIIEITDAYVRVELI